MRHHVPALRPVTQRVIHDHDGHERFRDRGGADADAGIVAAMGNDFNRLAFEIDRAAGQADGRRRLDRDVSDDGLARGNAAQYATRVIAQESLRSNFVPVFGALLPGAKHPVANLHAFHGIESHQCVGKVGIKLVIKRFAQAYRDILGHHGDFRAHRVTRLAQAVHIGFQLRNDGGARGKERVVIDLIPGLKRQIKGAKRRQVAAYDRAVSFLQPLLRNRSRADDGRGQPRGRSPAAAVVAQAILLRVGIVRMAGTEGLCDVAVFLAALIFVSNQQCNGRAGRSALKDAGQDFHRVRFLALGDVARRAGLAPVQIMLDVGLAQFHARRTAIHHAADGRAVGFAKNRHAEKFAECAAGHDE